MLKPSDKKWEELKDAYGTASQIPGLLEHLAVDVSSKNKGTKESWFSLWSKLCHQGDVYPASYAAVPRIVQIATNNIGKDIDMNFLLFPASIEIARIKGKGPTINEDIENEYNVAIKKMGELALNYQDSQDPSMKKVAHVAQLVASGEIDKANEILEKES